MFHQEDLEAAPAPEPVVELPAAMEPAPMEPAADDALPRFEPGEPGTGLEDMKVDMRPADAAREFSSALPQPGSSPIRPSSSGTHRLGRGAQPCAGSEPAASFDDVRAARGPHDRISPEGSKPLRGADEVGPGPGLGPASPRPRPRPRPRSRRCPR